MRWSRCPTRFRSKAKISRQARQLRRLTLWQRDQLAPWRSARLLCSSHADSGAGAQCAGQFGNRWCSELAMRRPGRSAKMEHRQARNSPHTTCGISHDLPRQFGHVMAQTFDPRFGVVGLSGKAAVPKARASTRKHKTGGFVSFIVLLRWESRTSTHKVASAVLSQPQFPHVLKTRTASPTINQSFIEA